MPPSFCAVRWEPKLGLSGEERCPRSALCGAFTAPGSMLGARCVFTWLTWTEGRTRQPRALGTRGVCMNSSTHSQCFL
ncbi:hypothetical protein Nmel_002192 [Mimus melanotis]